MTRKKKKKTSLKFILRSDSENKGSSEISYSTNKHLCQIPVNLTDSLWGHVTEPFYWPELGGSGVNGRGMGMPNVCTFGSQRRNGCPLIFHDFCTIRGKERGTKAIWCFERLQMALIRTYKICLPYSLRRRSGEARREGNWQKKEKKNNRKEKEKNKQTIQKVTSAKDCLIKIL